MTKGSQLDLFGGTKPAAPKAEAPAPEPAPSPTPAPTPETTGEAYLAMGIAHWEALVFLWDGGSKDVCAPWFGSSHDRYQKVQWINRSTAEQMLAAAGYAKRGTHTGPGPFAQPRTATVYINPDLDERLRRTRVKESIPAELATLAKLAAPESLDIFTARLTNARNAAIAADRYRRTLK